MNRFILYLSISLTVIGAGTALAAPDRSRHEAEYNQKAVAAILVAEAGCDKQSGMVGVAEVVRNRARQKRTAPLAIVKQPGVFSSLNDTDLPSLIRKHRSDPQFPAALRIAKVLLENPDRLPNTTRNATHFDQTKNTPSWAYTAQVTVTIGRHRFYRAPY